MKNQVSGSIAFDTEGLAAAAIAQVAEAISSIQQNLRTAIGLATGPLDDAAVLAVLTRHLPDSVTGRSETAAALGYNLVEAGYAIVPVGGQALMEQLDRDGLTIAPTFPTPEPSWLDRTGD